MNDYLGPYQLGPNDTPENGIYTGDARELAKAIPDESIMFAFADPPYWVGFDYGNRRTDTKMEYIDPQWLVTELQRVARTVCITPGIYNVQTYPKCDWIIGWFKGASRSESKIATFNTWDAVLFYGERQYSHLTTDAIWLHQPWKRDDYADGAFVVCPKPLALMIWLIEHLSNYNDIVFDPVCGSGTTAVAAKNLGRHYLAFEIDPVTANLARERVRNTQPPLFIPEPEQVSMDFPDV